MGNWTLGFLDTVTKNAHGPVLRSLNRAGASGIGEFLVLKDGPAHSIAETEIRTKFAAPPIPISDHLRSGVSSCTDRLLINVGYLPQASWK